MNTRRTNIDETRPRVIMRADRAPTDGYTIVVDGHFKSHYDTREAAQESGRELKSRFQMLQVEIYDSATQTRSLIEWPVAPA